MQRVLVTLLSALDALVAAVVGVAIAFAPLTVVWFIAFGMPEWSALWQTAASVWQLGHAVPLDITLPESYLVSAGIDASLAQFTLSLAPLGFAVITVLLGCRSGVRAARAGAWPTGVISGAVVFALAALLIGFTGGTTVAAVQLWQAIGYPAAFYAASLIVGALVAAWREGDDGPIDLLRDRLSRAGGAWSEVPGLIARGVGVALAGLAAAGALLCAVALVLRGGQIVALSESANLDLLGVIVVTLCEAMYLPTLAIWALSFLAGPGFAVGTGTSVTAAGTQLGVVPGIPVLGALPESISPWLFVLVLVPVGVGVFTGWMLRARIAAAAETVPVRLVLVAGVAVPTALAVLVACVLASGSIGPGRLTALGPAAWAVALAVLVEVGLGAGILLLGPRPRAR